ncbi:hypothetical protein DSM104443_01764 [Usitatibacter rugosus]|uniref:Uncharacterized protein n=1 Tax=Usitatibacter rugosus TaxID=2732067 RepID=A0A6M4GYU8_9PROT|nr:hypothetical protein [Usitatibacter rugosus]QJR10697.1 hypothetical protein DSM104443_01764 [Usitatibacter rugosus]
MSNEITSHGFTAAEVGQIMGGPMPPKDEPEQRRAYAELARIRLRKFDHKRFLVASLLLDAPDDLLDEWAAMSHEETLRQRAIALRERAQSTINREDQA